MSKKGPSASPGRLDTPVDATLHYIGRAWPARVLSRGPQDALISSSLATGLGSIFVCEPGGEAGGSLGLALECTVRKVMAPPSASDGFSSYLVRWRWAWCAEGLRALVERLPKFLPIEGELESDRLRTVEDGGLYAFDESALMYAAPTLRRVLRPKTDAQGPDTSRRASRGPAPRYNTTHRLHTPFGHLRAEERVRVDLPCRYVRDGDETSGWVRDLSRGGVRVATRWNQPNVGERVVVSLAPSIEGARKNIVLTGTVRRLIPGGDDGTPASFGMQVESVVDGHKGRSFHHYIDLLLSDANRLSPVTADPKTLEEATRETADTAPPAPAPPSDS